MVIKYITTIIVWDIQLFQILLEKFLLLELFQKLLAQMVFIMLLLICLVIRILVKTLCLHLKTVNLFMSLIIK